MFDSLKERVSKNKFATLSSDEANLVFEALDRAVSGLSKIESITDKAHQEESTEVFVARKTLEHVEFISKRPLPDKKEKI